MRKTVNSKSGFTLVEVLVSVGLVLIFLPFVASLLFSSQLMASYSKHKIQAGFAAKQIIESQRQLAAVNSTLSSSGPSPVILDTKGNYNNPGNYFYGTATVTVSTVTYVNNSGQTSAIPEVDHVVVQISWPEQVFKTKINMTETYAADIILNDLMLN